MFTTIFFIIAKIHIPNKFILLNKKGDILKYNRIYLFFIYTFSKTYTQLAKSSKIGLLTIPAYINSSPP